jgi:hypothetical protein
MVLEFRSPNPILELIDIINPSNYYNRWLDSREEVFQGCIKHYKDSSNSEVFREWATSYIIRQSTLGSAVNYIPDLLKFEDYLRAKAAEKTLISRGFDIELAKRRLSAIKS